jgi:hypothetical protein
MFSADAGEALSQEDKRMVRTQMDRWQAALTIADPAGGRAAQYIVFQHCGENCPSSHVFIRYNRAGEDTNMCSYNRGGRAATGRNPGGETVLHFAVGMPANTILSVDVTAPSGALSSGFVALTAADQDLVTGIDNVDEALIAIGFKLEATVAAGVIASATKTFTMTVIGS